MISEPEFQAAVARTKDFTRRPGNDELLLLYGLYKQATEGDVHGEKPGGFDFKGMAKWNAWEEQKGKPAETAKQEYVQLVNSLAETH